MAENTTPTHAAINGPAVNGPVTGGAAVDHPAANGPAANNPAVGDPAAGGPAINGSAVNGEDVLARICVTTRAEVTARKAATSLDALRQTIATQADKPRGFGRAIKHATGAGHYALIAEIKKASPSGGLIRADFDAATLAAAYAAGGATCLSVLTDARFFQGSNADLTAARGACALPMLRKDFILDPWQVYESRAIGADCILLIMAALTDAEARALEETARELDMDVLAEVHDRRELDRALGLQTQLIGINNRNLKTLRTDLAITEELAPLVPPDRFLVAESGITGPADLHRLGASGTFCFLVGESLMRQPDVTAAVRALLAEAPPGALSEAAAEAPAPAAPQ